MLSNSLVDKFLAISRLPYASEMPLSVAAAGLLGFATPVVLNLLCSLTNFPGFSGMLLASLVFKPFFLQHTSEVPFDPVFASGNQPFHKSANLLMRVLSHNDAFFVRTVQVSTLYIIIFYVTHRSNYSYTFCVVVFISYCCRRCILLSVTILVPRRLPTPFFCKYCDLAYHMILVLLFVVVLYVSTLNLAPRHLQVYFTR